MTVATFCCCMCACLFLGAERKTPPQPPPLTTESLQHLLERGTSAFTAGDFPSAAQAFRQVEEDFGAEAAWRDGALPRRLLPLRGFAELRAGMADAATDSLTTFVEQFAEENADRAFALFSLALALEQAGRPQDAITRFSEYEAAQHGTAQAALAALYRAEALASIGETDAALETWRTLASGTAPLSIRTSARLRALQVASLEKRNDLAEQLLLAEPWDTTTMPEIAALTFAAMETGDRLLADDNAASAVRAYRLALPRSRLIDAQRERLAALRERIARGLESSNLAAGNLSFWADFYRAREAAVAQQLEVLESSDDYTPALQLRRGQAYLLAGRPHEAWLVFEDLVSRSDSGPEIRAEAHYRWILASAALEDWDSALTIAREFVRLHEGSLLAPEALHLIARAHLERQRFDEAESVLTDILGHFPEHPASSRARFTRGWIRVMRERNDEAREDFARYLQDHPRGPLATQAQLWHALTFFFERDYDQALAGLERLAASSAGHPLYPEVLYRRATTRYAMRDHESARSELEAFVHDFPAHARVPEGLVLLGDMAMGTGHLDDARRWFAAIPPEATRSFAHGVFQTGLILRKTNDLAGMVTHLREYVARDDVPGHPRISEALYWIGWAEDKMGNPAAALPVFQDALDRFGDDRRATEIGMILEALERLKVRIARNSEAASALRSATVEDADFGRWLGDETQHAREAHQFVYEARLRVYAADRFSRNKLPHQEEATLLGLAGDAVQDSLDDHGLARVGMTLVEIGSPEGKDLLEKLLADFASSPERAVAFVGLAAADLASDRAAEALAWIERFDRETPAHALAPRASLVAGSALEALHRPEDALARYQEVMRLRAARGRLQAEALEGLARCYADLGEIAKAIGCHQRVYTLHRSQKDLVAVAYLESAALFSATDDLTAAVASYREMLSTADLGTIEQREQARSALSDLEPRLREQTAAAPKPAET